MNSDLTLTTETLTFPNAEGRALEARLELPADRDVAAHALFAHCFTCTKDIVAASRISRALAARGIGVLRFDFAGLGGSEGDFADTSFTSNVEDLLSAAQFMEGQGRAPALLAGHSLGGAAVLAAAGKLTDVTAVATIGAPSDTTHLKRLFSAADLAQIESHGQAPVALAGKVLPISRSFIDDLDRHDLLAEVRSLGRPLLIYHGPADDVVSIEHAGRLYQTARHPKSFISLGDADHLLSRPLDAQFVADTLAAWAARYVGADPSPGAPTEGGAPACEE